MISLAQSLACKWATTLPVLARESFCAKFCWSCLQLRNIHQQTAANRPRRKSCTLQAKSRQQRKVFTPCWNAPVVVVVFFKMRLNTTTWVVFETNRAHRKSEALSCDGSTTIPSCSSISLLILFALGFKTNQQCLFTDFNFLLYRAAYELDFLFAKSFYSFVSQLKHAAASSSATTTCLKREKS